MARLKVFLNGQFASQHDLDVSRELLAGRGETCDVLLNPDRGISRQHFRVRFAEGNWIVEVLSRFGELYKNGEKQSIFPLRDGTTFTVPPYEFVFEDEAEGLQQGTSEVKSSTMANVDGEDDKTHIGYLPSTAFLKLSDHRNHAIQSYRLEGSAWIGGRDTVCSIFIDNPRISRKQFEMQKQDEVYFIRDLGSVNGTLLNGRPLSTEDWTPLSSSDVITVADWSLQFELRDAQFEQRLSEVDPALMMPANYQDGAQGYYDDSGTSPAQGIPGAGFPPPQKPGMKLFGRHIPGLNPVRLGMIAVVFLALMYGLVEGFGGSAERAPAKVQTPFDKLPPEKQQVVKQLYVTAQSLLAQGRYELSRQEIIKLHQIIPYYEDSKQIEETANQGLAMLQEREKAEQEERQKAMREEKIQKQVAECRRQLNENSDSAWLEDCLSPVIEFDPEHPEIVKLRNEVNRLTDERAMKLARQKDYQEKVAKLLAIFSRAQKVEKEGLPLPAIAAYKGVLKTDLPDPHGVKAKSKRQIASLEDALEKKQLEAEQKSDAAYRAGQLKVAIQILREGIAVNPENESLKGKHNQYMGELRKQMMVFYQEGILEESVGEVETAKTKWKKIMDLSLPGEDYFEKAKIKLKKYGAL